MRFSVTTMIPAAGTSAIAIALILTSCGDGSTGPDASRETIPPFVMGTTPGTGAGGVSVDAFITATFSERLRPGSVTDASFAWSPSVAGRVSYAGTTATFTPAAALALGTTYTVTISPDVKDVAGNALSEPYSWSFTTAVPPFASITVGGFHSCAVSIAGAAYCWGFGRNGQLGQEATEDRLTPGRVNGMWSFADLSAGNIHTCGVTPAGAGYCWGINDDGELGDGETLPWPEGRSVPGPVTGNLNLSTVSAGLGHNCAIGTGAQAFCWGGNWHGQLGDGSTTMRLGPVPVIGGLSFVSVSAANNHSCGVTSGGAAYCWGWNGYGQLGDGTTTSRSSPVPVAGGHSFIAVDAAGWTTCGVATDGGALCWGANESGQLGDGTTTAQVAPVPVSGGGSFVAVDVAGNHACGLTGDGSAYCWGWNGFGQLGDGTTTARMTPVPVVGGLRFAALSLFHWHSCGLTPTGTVHCWGWNEWGQLGDGTRTNRHAPTPVR